MPVRGVAAAAICGICFCWTASRVAAQDLRESVRLFRTGDYSGCIEAATAELTANEFIEPSWVLKISSELELARCPEALQTLEAGLKSLPNSVQLRWIGRDVVRFNGQEERVAVLNAEIVALARQFSFRYSDGVNQVVLGRFLLSEGVEPKRVLDEIYGAVKQRSPSLIDPFLAGGDLALSKSDFALAAKEYAQVVKLDEQNADAHFGLARAFAESDAERAEHELQSTLSINPQHVPALLLIVDGHIDAERYDEAEAVLQRITEIHPRQPLAEAYRAVLARLRNDADAERRHRNLALADWPTNPAVDWLIGQKLSQKYRFAEGAEAQRRALRFDPHDLRARLQLSQDLLRLGQEDDGWRLANQVAAQDEYNVVAHNLVTLQENLAKFSTLEEDGFVLRMDAGEAEIYGPRVLDLLSRARRTLCSKYGVTLEGPIVIEMFPRQEDFAIRTFGLPGGAGFLGVCFGTVITANSPASQAASPACWEATLWHEFCHVVTLSKTHNRMPRWLSEGISVYEESQERAAWGQSLTPQYRRMLLGDELTPVSELSGAFLHAKSPLHLQFAYFESALVVEYFIETYGLESLLRVLDDLSAGLPVNEALGRSAGSIEELDAEFAAYARGRAEALAPDADWSEPELPRRADRAALTAYVERHPNNYQALGRLAAALVADENWGEARRTLSAMIALYPEDGRRDGPYPLLALVSRQLGENQAERAVLQKLADLSANNVDALERLTELGAAEGDWDMVREMSGRWLAINPLRPGPHRAAARAADELGDLASAVESYRALLKLDPVDPAELHLNLATALESRGDLSAARKEALFALEQTPRFRRAHARLASILMKIEVRDQEAGPPPPPRASRPAVRSSAPAPPTQSIDSSAAEGATPIRPAPGDSQ